MTEEWIDEEDDEEVDDEDEGLGSESDGTMTQGFPVPARQLFAELMAIFGAQEAEPRPAGEVADQAAPPGSGSLLERLEFEQSHLMAEFPPVLHDDNKRVVLDIACPPGARHEGTIGYTRWKAGWIPTSPPRKPVRVDVRPGFYDYRPTSDDPAAVEWHVNFADPHLFVAYGSSLFAQDEMQVAEHPVLGALKEALDAGGHRALTVEGGSPTPILITGASRRCAVATDPDVEAGRPEGLYGNRFARATADVVRRATTQIEPPTRSNLIAMAAPRGGFDTYMVEEIEEILITAFTAFGAAVAESCRIRGGAGPVVVHTGFWGCGAFGGNRVLMPLLQMIAAGWAEVDLLVFHVGDPSGAADIEQAQAALDALPAMFATAVPGYIETLGFRWGVSDGN